MIQGCANWKNIVINRLAVLVIIFSLALFGCAGSRPSTKAKARVFENLGNSLVMQSNFREGLSNLLKAGELDPKNAEIQHELALVYRTLGEYQQSFRHFKKALALKPQFPEAWNNLGTLYLLTEKWDEAIAGFQKASEDTLYKTPHFAYHNMGLAYFNKGECKKAIDNYLHALMSFPSYSLCHYNLARAYEADKNWDKAVSSYQKAISNYPEYEAAHLDLGKLFLKLGKKEKAGKELRLAAEIDPEGTCAREAGELIEKYQFDVKQQDD